MAVASRFLGSLIANEEKSVVSIDINCQKTSINIDILCLDFAFLNLYMVSHIYIWNFSDSVRAGFYDVAACVCARGTRRFAGIKEVHKCAIMSVRLYFAAAVRAY